MPSTDDIEPVRKVEIKISLQEEDFIDTRFANKEVTIRGSKNSYKAVTDEEGSLFFRIFCRTYTAWPFLMCYLGRSMGIW